jgi:Zn-dependent peptidase ImmA (M78 family)
VASFYRSPASLLDELGIREPEEIAIEAIAEYCGATILYQPLQGAEARIVGHGDRAIITVNEAAPIGRRRFSGAHELGHWMCDRGKIAFACTDRILTTEWSDENPERRANRYAVGLLLPSAIFSPYARNREVTFATVRDLADRFQTSLTATAIRLVELVSFPAMIVCAPRMGGAGGSSEAPMSQKSSGLESDQDATQWRGISSRARQRRLDQSMSAQTVGWITPMLAATRSEKIRERSGTILFYPSSGGRMNASCSISMTTKMTPRRSRVNRIEDSLSPLVPVGSRAPHCPRTWKI